MTNRTLTQRLARARQRETGEKYTTCLRYVEKHLDELSEAASLEREASRREHESPAAEQPRAESRADEPGDGSPLSVRFSSAPGPS